MSKNKPEFMSEEWFHSYFGYNTIYTRDIKECLLGKSWLNDSIITFYMMYLENVKYKDKQSDYLFLSPSQTFWIQSVQTEDDVRDSVQGLDIDKKQLIFMPLNNETDISKTSGGSHWSLVVYDRKRDTYFYYDSYGTTNLFMAEILISKIGKFVSPTKINLVVRNAPQQTNTYDCGVYTCAFTDYLAQKECDDTNMEKIITPQFVTNLRNEIFNLLQKHYEMDIKQ